MAFGDIVQYASSWDENNNFVDLSLPGAPAVGNLMVIAMGTGGSTCSPPSGWSQAVLTVNAPDADSGQIAYRLVQAGDGAGPYRCTANDNECSGVIFEVEGPWAAAPLDQVDTNGRNASTTYTFGPTPTTTQADEFAVAMYIARDSAVSLSGYTNGFVQLTYDSSFYKSTGAATKLLTATGAVSSTATGPAEAHATAVATFKKGAAGGAFQPAWAISNNQVIL